MSSPEAENAEAIVETIDAPVETLETAEVTAESLAAASEMTSEGAPAPAPEGEPAPGHVPAPSPANDPSLLRRALEGLLFITDRPLSAGELCKLVNVRDQDRIVAAVEELRAELEERNLGYRLIAVAEGWQMATRPELAPYMRKLFSDRATMRLSTAAQETLSIISYKQPLTRAEVEEIRGVEVIAALESLIEKRLIKVVGRKETVGRPLMYGTTMEFLRHFGLRSLEDLPPLERFAPADANPVGFTRTGDVPAPVVDAAPAEDAAPAAEASIEEAAAFEPVSSPEEVLAEEGIAEAASGDEPAGEEKEGLWPK
jgi:segregation and condensation protein B